MFKSCTMYMVKVIKAKAGFELITYRFVITALTHCAMLFFKKFGGKKLYNYT